MSFDIWPPISNEELRLKGAQTQERELAWIVARTVDACRELKQGLEDCHALLAPVDPGSTLVMSTPRNERVKGTITRVGTRIVKGSLGLQLRLAPAQTLSLSPCHDIRVAPLDDVLTRLTESIDLLGIILAHHDPDGDDGPAAQHLSSALRLLADAITSSIALLKGPSLADPQQTSWTTASVPPACFVPPLAPNLSFYFTVSECCLVLWLRVLEPADAPVHFGTKLGLAIGTLRRLEHDEMDLTFAYKPGNPHAAQPSSSASSSSSSSSKGLENVHVREKVRIESADPSLISLHAKLGYLSIMLGQTRRNLAAVMGVKLESW